MTTDRLSYGRILAVWIPLAGTWLMMAVEGPFLAAVIARLPLPTENLAAYGVAYSFAVIVESPVIMLMSASNALVTDRNTYLALRRFAYGLNVLLTVTMLVVLLPPVFRFLSADLLRLPEDVARLTRQGLVWLLPWPGAIGYRRFHQGLLIRRNLTRWVAYGTVLRLSSMGLTAVVASRAGLIAGVQVGAVALSAGVVAEACAAGLMTRGLVRALLARVEKTAEGTTATGLTLGQIVGFYVPLAMTSILAMAVQPMVTFFVGQSRLALESLAVLPVVQGLTFIFRSPGLAFQEVAIALLGERRQHVRPLGRFALGLAVAAALGLTLIAFSPLAFFWFHDISGLPQDLAWFALLPTRILAVIPALAVALGFERAVLVHRRATRYITWATATEVTGIALVLAIGIGYLDMVGAVVASLALVLGRVCANLMLVGPVRRGTMATG